MEKFAEQKILQLILITVLRGSLTFKKKMVFLKKSITLVKSAILFMDGNLSFSAIAAPRHNANFLLQK
jgi:hypothetical protein